jgi:hypothetical protein
MTHEERVELARRAIKARLVEGEEVTDREAIRRLIQQQLHDGRLPHQNAARARGSPADGAICDACGRIITANQVMMGGRLVPGRAAVFVFPLRLLPVMEHGVAHEADLASIASGDTRTTNQMRSARERGLSGPRGTLRGSGVMGNAQGYV